MIREPHYRSLHQLVLKFKLMYRKLKIVLFTALVLTAILAYRKWHQDPCEERITYSSIDQEIDLDSLFLPAQKPELDKIWNEWDQFDTGSDSFQIVLNLSIHNGRATDIIGHYKEGTKHYGAVIHPRTPPAEGKIPVLMWVEGLDQFNPHVDILKDYIISALSKSLPDHLLVIPSFRGQSLRVGKHAFCSDGFFGDAFDGATDDALRFLQLVREQYAIDEENISIYGISRGGTVALLAGARESSFKNIITQAGPTDFLDRAVYNKFGMQYKYQFLSRDTAVNQIRTKIIKSSPLHFCQYIDANILLIHGRNDKTVDISNAQDIINKLSSKDNFTSVITESGHQANHISDLVDFISE